MLWAEQINRYTIEARHLFRNRNGTNHYRRYSNKKRDLFMFSHIMLGANDVAASKKFYDAIMDVLGHKPGVMDEKGRCFYFEKTGVFSLSKPIDGQPATGANGSTIGFAADNPETIDAWHAAGLAHGGTTIEDPPGLRGTAPNQMYLAYLRDPSGNKICALHRIPA